MRLISPGNASWIPTKFIICLIYLLRIQPSSSTMFDYRLYSKLNMEALEAQSNTPNWNRTGNDKFVVELALFCDRDFGSLFQHNKTKMLQYWQAVLYDVQLRYKTLPSVNVTFRVTYFRALENAEQQLFVEKARFKPGSVFIQHVFNGFEKWVYNKVKQKPTFDIAILALGAWPLGNEQALANSGTICEGNIFRGKWLSNIVLSTRSGDTAGVLAHEIAHVLGAPHDNTESYVFHECGQVVKQGYYLMSIDGGINRQVFSPCTDKILASKFRHFPMNCLENISRNMAPIIDTDVLTAPHIPIQEQCRLLTNDSSTMLTQNELNCSAVICPLKIESNSPSNYLIPFNGSPCKDINGQRGTCFRETCIPQGILFISSEHGSCFTGLGGFTSNSGNLVPTNCSELLANPLDVIHLVHTDGNGIFLTKHYWNPENKIGLKCLTFPNNTENGWVPVFEPCKPNPIFGWELRIISNKSANNEFLVIHRDTQLCLAIEETSGKLFGLKNCSLVDGKVVWKMKLVNGTVLTHDNFKDFIIPIESKEYVWTWFDMLSVLATLHLLYLAISYIVVKLRKLALSVVSRYYNKNKLN